MKRSFLRLLVRLAVVLFVSVPAILAAESFAMPGHAAGTNGNLAVFLGYAEDKETNTPPPGAFPNPWDGSPNVVFLGGPVVGQTACGKLPLCYDAGAIRLDNS